MPKKKKILLVDDDADMLDIGRIIIQRAGFEFLGASSGEEGLAKVVAEEPDLIILDYMMPTMNGLEFFRAMRQEPEYERFRDIPVIMLTARNGTHVDQTELFESGLSAFLIKPFGHRELINIIENVLKMAEIRRKNVELEHEIERTRYKYRDLIENANDLIFMLDTDGRVNFVNRRLKHFTGLPPDEWMDHFLVDLVIPQDEPAVEAAIHSCLDGNSAEFQMHVRDSQNFIRYFSTTLNPVEESGKVTGMVGIARDVTEKIELESRIANLESFTQSIIKSIKSGLMTISKAREITFVNAAAEEILGIRAQDVLNKKIDQVFPAPEAKKLLGTRSRKKSEPLVGQEIELTRGDGKKVHIGYSVTPWFDSSNHILGSIITFRDISESKKMQLEMVRMDRLASLGVLAAGIAHEIRNPLAGIKTIAQTLEEEVPEDHPHREYLQRIVRQVNRLDELLKAFFSYARPRPPIKKMHRLPDIVHEVQILLNKRLRSNSVAFRSKFEPDLKPVFVDLNQIQQVLLNLFINAIDAMPKGGQLSLTARTIRTKLSQVDRRGRNYQDTAQERLFTEIIITDTGVGIKQEHLQAIFDPFFTTKPQGTGLGLSIVYRIIQEHGGEISVTSEVGKGSSFRILLPSEE